MTVETELELVAPGPEGALRARVSDFGASLRGLWLDMPGSPPWEAIRSYSGAGSKRGGQGDVLLIHGLARPRRWELVSRGEARASFRARLSEEELGPKGYPFTLEANLEYRLQGLELLTRAEVRNSGSRPAPVGIGFHPYCSVGQESIDPALLELPCASLIELGPGFVPTGRVLPVEGGEVDFLGARAIGSTRINHCFARLLRDRDGVARARLVNPVDGRTVTLSMDRALDYLVVSTGDALGPDARRSVAIEPMSCGNDAFNHPEWGLKALAPGEGFSVAYSVALAPPQRSAVEYSGRPK